ncbi:MAG: tRNA 2-selenouridine synthase [Cyclobacteriaceae bacterium]|jgi:tRNA 2-selenouridine synthase
MKRLNAQDFLLLSEKTPIIDVRSPVEFEQGRLPNALNMPLFSNEERTVVGTLYKQQGPLIAFKKGLDYIGPKMSSFIRFVEKLESRELLVHCWRGGNRSQSVALLLEAAGFSVSVLSGGYKAYRKTALDFFSQPLPLIVLTGYTGSLKTEVLHVLTDQGEQVVDLEGLACHQGSAFGRQLSQLQPTSEQFQNQLYEAFRAMDLNRRIWVEDESMSIGAVNLVSELYLQKNAAPCVFLDVPQDMRLQNLIKNYSNMSKELLIEATIRIQKKLGQNETAQAIEFINGDEALEAAKIILKYYDKRYFKSIENKMDHLKLHLEINSNDPIMIANEILSKL